MELRQLRYLEAVARHRHFTRAAEELHVAQSALSHQIRRLEAELGAPLFARTSRSVVPTEAGAALAARARRVLDEVEAGRAEIDALQGLIRGRLTIGAMLPAGELDVPRLLTGFSGAHPGIEMVVREGTAGDMLRHLAEGEVDAAFALVAGPLPDGITSATLSEEELVAVFPPGGGDPDPDRAVPLAELAGRPLITPRADSAVRQALEEATAGAPLRITLESGDPFFLRCLAAVGFGTAILPRSLAERDGPPVVAASIDPPLRLPVGLLWPERRHLSPAARAFVEHVRRAAAGPQPTP